jgi:benzoylformate decarboxylase
MAADLVAMARPVTKWSTVVADPASTLRVLRRAIKIAATPPMGPVYVCLPQDVLDAVTTEPVRPTSIPSTRVVPNPALLEQAADILLAADQPMIFIGNGVAWSQAQAEVEQVAELLGAEVWEADGGELNMRHDHPLYQGSLGHMFSGQSRPATMKGDANLIVGTYMVPEVFPSLEDIFASHAQTIHIDLNAYEIAKNHPVTLGLVSDPKLTLARLAEIIAAKQSTAHAAEAAARTTQSAATKAGKLAAGLGQDGVERVNEPLHFSEFMGELSKHLPHDVIVFDEALTNSPPLMRHLPPNLPGHFFQTRGGSLGVGIPGAIGAKMARPDKMVFGFTGDGGAMYTIQALWTAARHNIDAKFVICNNRSYRLLQLNIGEYWKEIGAPSHEFPLSFDLSRPELRFDQMARAMGVPAVRIETVDQIRPAILQALNTPGPFLLDVVIEGDVRPDLIGVRCGQ